MISLTVQTELFFFCRLNLRSIIWAPDISPKPIVWRLQGSAGPPFSPGNYIIIATQNIRSLPKEGLSHTLTLHCTSICRLVPNKKQLMLLDLWFHWLCKVQTKLFYLFFAYRYDPFTIGATIHSPRPTIYFFIQQIQSVLQYQFLDHINF
jgi:hypothetical protein